MSSQDQETEPLEPLTKSREALLAELQAMPPLKVPKDRLQLEFEGLESLSSDRRALCSVATRREVRHKNRFSNVLPTDNERVVLKPLDQSRLKFERQKQRAAAKARAALCATGGVLLEACDSSDSDGSSDDESAVSISDTYINASYYCQKDSQKQTYISAQAPLPYTFEDFWRMIEQTRSPVIVMVTDLVDTQGRRKADQYWPNTVGESFKYLEFTVEFVSERASKYVCEREFKIVPRTDNTDEEVDDEPLIVRQIQYLGWPDHGVPDDTGGLEDLIRRVNLHKGSLDVPITVHCSAGIGRTGTFIAAHSGRQDAVSGKGININGTVAGMREGRPGMVQNSDQYRFAHAAIEDMLKQLPSATTGRENKKHGEDMGASGGGSSGSSSNPRNLSPPRVTVLSLSGGT